MSKLTVPQQVEPDSVTGHPNEPWFSVLIDKLNSISRQVVSTLNGKLDVTDTLDRYAEVDLLDSTSTSVRIPLDRGVILEGIYPVRCQGLTLNADGSQTRGTFTLALPVI